MAGAQTGPGYIYLFECDNYLRAGVPLLDVRDRISDVTQLIALRDHRRDSSGFHQLA